MSNSSEIKLNQTEEVEAKRDWLVAALKAGELADLKHSGAELVELLIEASHHPDSVVAGRAGIVLMDLTTPAAKEELCRLVIEAEHPIAQNIAVGAGYAPHQPHLQALFFFLTGQWEKYHRLDFDRHYLKLAYHTASPPLRKRIAEYARQAGRLEIVEVLAGSRLAERGGQALDQLNSAEWELLLELLMRGKHYLRLWELAQLAPPLWAVPIFRWFSTQGWLPEREDEKLAFNRLVQLAENCKQGPSLMGRLLTQILRLEAHNHWVNCLALSPDGQLMASGGEDGKLLLWNLKERQLLASFEQELSESDPASLNPWEQTLVIKQLAFSPDGRQLAGEGGWRSASGNWSSWLKLFDLTTGRVLTTLPGHPYDARISLQFSPQGEVLLSSSSYQTRLWQLPGGELRSLKDAPGWGLRCAAISPDGRILAGGTTNGKLWLWRLLDGQLQRVIDHRLANFNCLAFSPDNFTLAAASSDYGNSRYHLYLWNLLEPFSIPTLLKGHRAEVESLTFSPDRKLLVSGSQDGQLRLWNYSKGHHVFTLNGHQNRVTGVAFSPDSQLLVSASQDHTISLWSSRLVSLAHQPVRSCSLNDFIWTQHSQTRQNPAPTRLEQGWLKFIEAQLGWHWRHEIEVNDSPGQVVITSDEFAIELDSSS